MFYHSTLINANPPQFLSLNQYVSSSSVNQSMIIREWFHVIIKIQPLIPYRRNLFCPIGGIENTILNRVPWGRWWGGQILDI